VVSVLLPARDAARTVGRALRSVLRSRAVALEVVAVEHGSRDGTPAVLAAIAAREERVRIVRAPAELSLAAALELGRGVCQAPLIARMDADDIMHPHRLAADVRCLTAAPGLAAISSRVKLIPKNGTTAGMRAYVAWQNAILTPAEHQREIWIEQPLCHPATTFRASALAAVGGWRDAACPEDYDLFLRLALQGHAVEKRPAIHHAWRQHAQTSMRWPRDAFARRKAMALVERFGIDERPVVIAGAGKEGGRMGRALSAAGVRPAAFLDVAARRIGRTRHGAAVLPASELGRLPAVFPGVFVIAAVGTSGSRGVVRAELAAAGFIEGEDCVVVA
jgi:GT2 family glycosyltransferase